jgi:hypothetical protein
MATRVTTAVSPHRSKVAVAGLLLGLLFAAAPRAACPVDSSLYVLLHPAFRSAIWSRALQETNVSAVDSLCTVRPGRLSMAGKHPNGFAIFAPAAGGSDLYLSRVTWRLGSSCGLPSLTAAAPQKLPFTLAVGAPFHALVHPLYGKDSLMVAVGVSPLLVQVYTLRVSTLAIMRVDNLNISQRNAGQAATLICGASDTLGGSESGIWVGGAGGLLRRFTFSAGAWSTEQVRDIDALRSVTAVGEGWAATDNGNLYHLQPADTFAFDSRPLAAALRRISAAAGVGDNGALLIRSSGAWQSRTVGGAPLVAFNLIKHSSGSAVELLDSAWHYRLYTWADSATRLAAFDPPDLALCRNTAPCARSILTHERWTIDLADPDSNQTPPAVTVRTQSSGVRNLLVASGADTLRQRQSEITSRRGLTQLAGLRITLDLQPGLVSLSAPSLRAEVVPTCTTLAWVADTFSASSSWVDGDTLCIRLGSDSLRIVLSRGSVTTSDASRRPQAVGRSQLTLLAGASVLRVPLDARITASVRQVRIFDARGSLVACLDAAEGRSVLPMGRLPRGMLVVQLLMSDGTTRTVTALPALR